MPGVIDPLSRSVISADIKAENCWAVAIPFSAILRLLGALLLAGAFALFAVLVDFFVAIPVLLSGLKVLYDEILHAIVFLMHVFSSVITMSVTIRVMRRKRRRVCLLAGFRHRHIPRRRS
jgi:hypothetical protein